ncbi:MAG: OmpA family protein [Phycisphaerales bacterium]|nr:OmpA family protein [Phycisphaerales bacterium]
MALMRMGLAALAASVLMAGGCAEQQLKDEIALLENENTELRAQLDNRDTALETANDELRRANRELRDAQDAFAEERDTWTEAQTNAFDNIEGVNATYSDDGVTVSVEGDVLFASGRTSLRQQAKSSLDKVASVLKQQYGGKTIFIAGHTDTDPIKKSGHKSNYHLGFERGWAVRKYLMDQGVTGTNMAIISFGPDRPMGSASTSRRVEIVVAD